MEHVKFRSNSELVQSRARRERELFLIEVTRLFDILTIRDWMGLNS